MKDLIGKLTFFHKQSKKQIAPTIRDYYQFEKNIYHSWLEENYRARLDFIQKTFDHIGKEVYKYKDNRLTYAFKCNAEDFMNKTEETPVILTQQMYDKFEIDYLNFTIERISEELLTRSPFEKSTSAFGNLVKLVETEAKQEFLRELRELLKGW